MIDFYEQLMQEEQESVKECIQTLLRQSFILEMKYDRKCEKVAYNPQFKICNKYFEFLTWYFRIGGIELRENSQMGIMYIQGETTLGEKISRLATVYILILKVLYDEKMSAVSNSMQVVTTLSKLNEKAGSYGVITTRPSNSEIRRALALLKK